MALRLYAFITLLIGVTEVAYNALWLGATRNPFPAPRELALFELAWSFVSFAVLLRWRRLRLPVLLSGSYVVYTALAVFYAMGDEAMPAPSDAWKILALIMGLWFTGAAARIFVSSPGRRSRRKSRPI